MPFAPEKLEEAIESLDTYHAEFARMLTKGSDRHYTQQHIYGWLNGKSPDDISMDDIVRVTKKRRDFFYKNSVVSS